MELNANSGANVSPIGLADNERNKTLMAFVSRHSAILERMSEDEQTKQIEAWNETLKNGLPLKPPQMVLDEEDAPTTQLPQSPLPSRPVREMKPLMSFVFYESYYNAIKNLPPASMSILFQALCEYGLYRKEPIFPEDSFRPFLEGIWESFKPSLDANYQRRLNGLRGGSPKGPRPAMAGNQNARKKPNQPQPKQNQNKTKTKAYVYEDVYEDENVKKEDLSFPFLSSEFMSAWTVLREQPNWKKKSNHALQLSLNKLAQYPEAFAIHLVQEATERGWTGVVFDSTPDTFSKWQQSHPEGSKIITSISDLYQ